MSSSPSSARLLDDDDLVLFSSPSAAPSVAPSWSSSASGSASTPPSLPSDNNAPPFVATTSLLDTSLSPSEYESDPSSNAVSDSILSQFEAFDSSSTLAPVRSTSPIPSSATSFPSSSSRLSSDSQTSPSSSSSLLEPLSTSPSSSSSLLEPLSTSFAFASSASRSSTYASLSEPLIAPEDLAPRLSSEQGDEPTVTPKSTLLSGAAQTMRGILLHGTGSEEHLHLEDKIAIPSLGKGDVCVRINAVALSRVDHDVVCSRYRDISPDSSARQVIPGYEVSGVIETIGSEVPPPFAVGSEVCGLLPVSSESGGCADFCVQPYFFFVIKPTVLSHEEAAALLLPGIRAFTALHYQMRAAAGETILITNAASDLGYVATQLAGRMQMHVFATTAVANSEEADYLENLSTDIVRLISPEEDLLEVIATETDGMGVDFILENPSMRRMSSSSSSSSSSNCTATAEGTHLSHVLGTATVASLLAARGVWVTSRPNVELDEDLSAIFRLKSLALSFVDEQTWVTAPTQLGRYQHILRDLLVRAEKGELCAKISKLFPLHKIREAHRTLLQNTTGRVVCTPL